MSIVDFFFFDENKFIVTDETDVAIYNDLGKDFFVFNKWNCFVDKELFSNIKGRFFNC
jgi:hypothetical protein